jgi:septal ring factor EnvC (AmiA/AmiB activator)
VKDLNGRFAEAERRVRDLVDENRRLRARVQELEQELAPAREAARELEELRGRQDQVRQRLERMLSSLEALDLEELPRRSAEPVESQGP